MIHTLRLRTVNIVLILLTLMVVNCGDNSSDADPSQNPNAILINTASRLANTSVNPAGVVSCWLMDSDIERPRQTSFKTAMQDMGVKYIRFPYGELSDNYLWDADGEWGGTLTPKVANLNFAPGTFRQGEGDYWAVDQATKEFKKDMDFDEYISICEELGAVPMVVVNVGAYRRNNAEVTKEYLLQNAVEWVKYANITKGYNVKRWALGNEVDHKQEFSLNEYVELYKEFAAAMKEVDPTIMIGPGVLNKWYNALLGEAGDLIDFVCVHNYLFSYSWTSDGYEGWRDTDDTSIHNVDAVQQVIETSDYPDIEIHVTEMNSRPWKTSPDDDDDFFRALVLGEMTLNSLRNKNVVATYCWNTHSPWEGPDTNQPCNLLDLDNNREPRGEVSKLINDYTLDWLLGVRRLVGDVRLYASASEENDQLNIIAINKGLQSASLPLQFDGFQVSNVVETITYVSSDPGLAQDPDPYSKTPVVVNRGQELISNIRGNSFEAEIPALSMTIIRVN